MALERWHVGPWTTRGTVEGEPFEPGLKRTPDELNFDIVGLSRILGRQQSTAEEMLMRRCQGELRPTDPRLCGVETIPDEDIARQLTALAGEAFDWIAQQAPEGYEFVRTDAIHLRPLTDLSAEVVAVDAVIQLATERGDALPADRLAAAHVRPSQDAWYAGDAVSNWSGPYPTAEQAADAVRAARVELTTQLTEAGHPDLAATATRWPEVPIATP
ncbi:hypothetical protein [Streptomyces sp. SID13031]|uniref:hypothetical protein n=1 Tax=Streptomyces sp. SID13031 TaxID=2706046 RepID=UPI0013C9BEC4|nr:hypothetical protein [Streptomyces sp. SID13031]NEA33783.1 hypothetical protein [Streptomyces sp. SID13031]